MKTLFPPRILRLVADPLTRGIRGEHQPGIGGEPVSTLGGTKIAYGDQEPRSKKRSQATSYAINAYEHRSIRFDRMG